VPDVLMIALVLVFFLLALAFVRRVGSGR